MAFDDIIGHERQKRFLNFLMERGNIPHAFLFCGQEGIGKSKTAMEFTKRLFCQTGTGCGICRPCVKLDRGSHPDLIVIRNEGSIGIDDSRMIAKEISEHPFEQDRRVIIIDNAETMTNEAANALLKTLEEPPAHVVFMFATTETHKVPATILSRCQNFEFRRLALRQIVEQLRKISDAEKIEVSDTALAWIAEAGDGSMRDSESIFDQVISYAGTTIGDEAVEDLLGRTDRRFLFQLSEAVLHRDAGQCLKIIDEGYYAGLDMTYFYQLLLRHFRNLLLVRIVGRKQELLDISGSDLERLEAQAAEVSRETLRQLLDILLAEEENVRRSRNPRLNLETIVCRMAALPPAFPLAEVLARMEELEARLAASPPLRSEGSGQADPPVTGERTLDLPAVPTKVESVKEPVPELKEPSRGQAKPEDVWGNFKNHVKKHSVPLASQIEQGEYLGCQNGKLRIGFRNHMFFEAINDSAQKNRLNEIAGSFFQSGVMVEIESLEPEPGSRGAEKISEAMIRKNSIEEIRREALNHPLLQKVMSVFEGAEVQEVKVRTPAKQPPEQG